MSARQWLGRWDVASRRWIVVGSAMSDSDVVDLARRHGAAERLMWASFQVLPCSSRAAAVKAFSAEPPPAGAAPAFFG